MTRVIYNCAATLDGFIADSENSLTWLFAVETDGTDAPSTFMQDVGVLVEGSTTYEWILREQQLLEHPEQWQTLYGTLPTFVFTTRQLQTPAGADVRFISGSVADALPQLREVAGSKNIWVVGGGDLAGQFLDADALDEVQVALAPVTLGAGAPLLPRRAESNQLRLISVEKRGQFANVTYAVSRSTASRSAGLAPSTPKPST
jgi:dihydrofolate reductase